MHDSSCTSMMRITIHTTLGVQPQRKTHLFLPILSLGVICILGMVWPTAGAVHVGSGPTDKPSTQQTDLQRLEGRWVRPDGGYVLELTEIKKDGSLKAAYFNPRSIKVFSAKWSRKEGKINLLLELRDVNYPGSKYNLQYDPTFDRLRGTYFQAVEKQTFSIEFVRGR
jgi:hypothetical protein